MLMNRTPGHPLSMRIQLVFSMAWLKGPAPPSATSYLMQSCIAKRLRARTLEELHGFLTGTIVIGACQEVVIVKSLPPNVGRHKGHRFDPWVGKILWRRIW